MNKLSQILLQVFFPRHCGFCDTVIEYDRLVCDYCSKNISYVPENKLCNGDNPLFLSIAPLYYSNGADKAVADLKFKTKLSKATVLSDYMVNALVETSLDSCVDLVVPVPLYKRDFGKRGYNQSEFLAREVAKGINRPMNKTSLLKPVQTKKQHELSREERATNLKNAFFVKDSAVFKGKVVLLIDDVLTTGATASACAVALRNAGVKEVIMLTATKTENVTKESFNATDK